MAGEGALSPDVLLLCGLPRHLRSVRLVEPAQLLATMVRDPFKAAQNPRFPRIGRTDIPYIKRWFVSGHSQGDTLTHEPEWILSMVALIMVACGGTGRGVLPAGSGVCATGRDGGNGSVSRRHQLLRGACSGWSPAARLRVTRLQSSDRLSRLQRRPAAHVHCIPHPGTAFMRLHDSRRSQDARWGLKHSGPLTVHPGPFSALQAMMMRRLCRSLNHC